MAEQRRLGRFINVVCRPAIPFAVAFACAALSLAGCTDIKRGLGMEKVVPDEFAVTASALEAKSTNVTGSTPPPRAYASGPKA